MSRDSQIKNVIGYRDNLAKQLEFLIGTDDFSGETTVAAAMARLRDHWFVLDARETEIWFEGTSEACEAWLNANVNNPCTVVIEGRKYILVQGTRK